MVSMIHGRVRRRCFSLFEFDDTLSADRSVQLGLDVLNHFASYPSEWLHQKESQNQYLAQDWTAGAIFGRR